MVSSILWYQSARRAAFTLPINASDSANPLAQHIAVLLFEKLVNKRV
jgi:hypothetical protein